MAVSQTALDLFQHELPDPTVELYGQTLSQFIPFPNVPIELRLQIWQIGIASICSNFYESRCVCLSGECLYYAGEDWNNCWSDDSRIEIDHREARKVLLNLKKIFPATLHVDRESRSETRKRIAFLWPRDNLGLFPQCTHRLCQKIPLWFNPSVDSLFIPSWQNYLAPHLNQLTSWIDAQSPQMLQKIEHLDIWFDLHYGTYDDILFLNDLDVLLNFTSLKSVMFIDAFGDYVPEDPIHDFRCEIAEWFQGLPTRGKSTNITIIYYRQLVDRSKFIPFFIKGKEFRETGEFISIQ